jgi:hypothetical protein
MKLTAFIRRQQRQWNNRDYISLVLLIASVIFTSSLTPAPYMASMRQITTTTETYSVNQNSSTAVVVSTTIPNVQASTDVQQEVAEQARMQLTLEKEIADQIAYEEEQERIRQEYEAEQERLRQIELARQARIDYINAIVCDPDDISRVTGLDNIEDYKLLTKDTWWEGYEESLMELEEDYGINALFAMAVSTIESGRGTSVRASSRHNYYGIELSNKSWADLGDNTLWWGGMLNRDYVGKNLLSVWDIGPVYCPPNREWETAIVKQMNKYYDNLIINLKDTVD